MTIHWITMPHSSYVFVLVLLAALVPGVQAQPVPLEKQERESVSIAPDALKDDAFEVVSAGFSNVQRLTLAAADYLNPAIQTRRGVVSGSTDDGSRIDGQWSNKFAAPGPNGHVGAIDFDGNLIYAGGVFSAAGGIPIRNVAVFDTATQVWSPLGDGVDGQVTAIEVASDGTVYVAGLFQRAGVETARHVARYDPRAESWSALGEGTDGHIDALVLADDGTLYVGGDFDTAGSAAARNVARWDGNAWHSLGDIGTAGSRVSTLALSRDRLYVGGRFTAADDVSVRNVAAYHLDSGTWDALGGGLSRNVGQHVRAIETTQSGIYVSGRFDVAYQSDGTPAPVDDVAYWDETTSQWQPLGGDNESDQTLAVSPEGVLYTGGLSGSEESSYMQRWNGTEWEEVESGLVHRSDLEVAALEFHGPDLYVGLAGYFYIGSPGPAGFLYRRTTLDPELDAWEVVGSGGHGMNAAVRALARGSNGAIYAGGEFRFAGKQQANYVARWNGTAWSPLGGGLDGPVAAITTAGNRVYVAGTFSQASDFEGARVPANHVAAWDVAESTWHPLGAGIPGVVNTLATGPDGDIYAGGGFAEVRTSDGEVIGAQNIARYDADTGAWTTLPAGHGIIYVTDLAFDRAGRLYAGGVYVRPDGWAQGRIARYDPQMEQWTVIREWFGSDNVVFAVDRTSGDYGTLYAGVLNQGTWQYDGAAWSDLGGESSPDVLAVDGKGTLYSGGNQVMRWDDGHWEVLGTGAHAGTGAAVLALLPADDVLWLGGYLQMAGGEWSSCIAWWEYPIGDRIEREKSGEQAPLNVDAFPNPASTVITARFHVDAPGTTRLEIFDITGRRVARDSRSHLPPGSVEVTYDVAWLPSGVYTVVLRTPHDSASTFFVKLTR